MIQTDTKEELQADIWEFCIRQNLHCIESFIIHHVKYLDL